MKNSGERDVGRLRKVVRGVRDDICLTQDDILIGRGFLVSIGIISLFPYTSVYVGWTRPFKRE